jgi:flavin reductase (DIM6/NTAB) family NADH-FMN oxidoreductase RutF
MTTVAPASTVSRWSRPAFGPAPAGRASGAEHRVLMGSFPTGVTVVTAVDGSGQPHGLTCTSLASVSADPPMILICLNVASGTYRAVRESGAFAVNLLRPTGRRAAEIFSSAVADRFAQVDWVRSPAGIPWLAVDSVALADCLVSAIHLAADHAIVVGTVDKINHRAEAVLMYGMRRFSCWPVTEGDQP